jgi:hypothetical protein
LRTGSLKDDVGVIGTDCELDGLAPVLTDEVGVDVHGVFGDVLGPALKDDVGVIGNDWELDGLASVLSDEVGDAGTDWLAV